MVRKTENEQRIQSLEGLRGIMAIAVLNCHVLGLFPSFATSFIQKIFAYTPLAVLISGGSVYHFFLY